MHMMSSRAPAIACLILLLHQTSSSMLDTTLSFLFAVAFVAFHGMCLNILAGIAFKADNLLSYALPEKPLCTLVVCLIGARQVLKTQMSIGVVTLAVATRVISLLSKQPLPEFRHKVYGKSSHEGHNGARASSSRRMFCRAMALRSITCLILLLSCTSYITGLHSIPLAIACVTFGAFVWVHLVFNIFDFDQVLCGGTIDSIEHIDAKGGDGVITRQPADSEVVFCKHKYTIPVEESRVITDGEKLTAAACACFDELLDRQCSGVRYLGRLQGESNHRFLCCDENKLIDIDEKRILQLARSKGLQIIHTHSAQRVPIIPKEVKKIIKFLRSLGQYDGVLSCSPKHEDIYDIMNNNKMIDTGIPVLSAGKWFSSKAWFLEALLDGVVYNGVDRPTPFAGYLLGKSFFLSTTFVVLAIALYGSAVVTQSSSEQTPIYDYFILWLSAWCVCTFIAPHSICLFYDDSLQHTVDMCTHLGVSSVHVVNTQGHLTNKEVILLQLHHTSLFVTTVIFTTAFFKND